MVGAPTETGHPKLWAFVEQWLQDHAITAVELSRQVGISHAILSNLKYGGRISVESMFKLGEAMGVSKTQMLVYAGLIEPPTPGARDLTPEQEQWLMRLNQLDAEARESVAAVVTQLIQRRARRR